MDSISISPSHPVCDQPPGPPAHEAERSLRDGAGCNCRARILNTLCVLIKRLSAAYETQRSLHWGTRVKLVFSVPKGVFSLEFLFWQRNMKLIARKAHLPGSSEDRSLRCHLPYPTFWRAVTSQGVSLAAGRPSQPAVTVLLFLALVWSRT